MRQTCREALFQYKFNDLAWRVRDEKSRREGGGENGRSSRAAPLTAPCQEPRGEAGLRTRIYRGVFRARCTRVKLVPCNCTFSREIFVRRPETRQGCSLTRSIKSTNSLAIEENAPSFGGYPAYDVISFSRVYIEKSVFHVKKKLKEI